MDPDYKLIYCVDPSKIKLNVREKFAKLTLSSNKKKNEAAGEASKNPGYAEACKHVSRNLLEDLEAAGDDIVEEANHGEVYVNPILRSSESTFGSSDVENESAGRKFEIEPGQTSNFTQSNDFDHVADRLSQQVSAMKLESSGISVSLTEDLNGAAKHAGNMREPQHLAAEKNAVSICISSTSSEDDDDSASAITISDSDSDSPSENYDLITSDIPKTGQTADQRLPNTLSNDRADRIEAFLRDVSQARKEMELERGQVARGEAAGKRDTESMSQDSVGCPSFSSDASTNVDAEALHINLSRRLAYNETVDNSVASPQQQTQPRTSRCLADNETVANTTISNFDGLIHTLSVSPEHQTPTRISRCLADNETVANTTTSNFDDSRHAISASPESQTPRRISRRLAYNNTVLNRVSSSGASAEQKTPPRASRRLAANETVANTIISNSYDSRTNSSPEQTPEKICNNDSVAIDSLNNSVAPEESLTILETGSEDESNQEPLPLPSKNTAQNAETQTQTSVGPSSEGVQPKKNQKTQNSINISAKINIKIHISQQMSTEDEEQETTDDGESPPLPDTYSESQAENQKSSRTHTLSNQKQSSSSSEEGVETSRENEPPRGNACGDKQDLKSSKLRNNKEDNQTPKRNKRQQNSSPTSETVDQKFMNHAQKLLNQIYGNKWQTPEVMRTLIRTRIDNDQPSSADKDLNTNQALKDIGRTNSHPEEDSVLDDFSIFRRNIKTNLNSTRKAAASPKKTRKKIQNRDAKSERKFRSPQRRDRSEFKAPQTEARRTARKGKELNERWRQLISAESDEDCGNASEDEEPDKTGAENSSDANNSDKSWSKDIEANSSFSSSGSEDISFRRRNKKKANPPKAHNKKSKLVYLDLSKNEVEIVQGTPVQSSDDDLKRRLQIIISECKFEDKPKLEATPRSTKTKRKLFTANFGNECEDLLSDTHNADTPGALERRLLLDDQDVNIKHHAMPSKYEPFNKQLEAVKTGTPIFKIQTPKTSKFRTPSGKKGNMTPTTKQNDDGDAQDIPTPTDKYGFLKSLDVCVSKCYCHPEALYYRENYRQKKEELAMKLYDLYNKKVFENKLHVSIVWNKKLLNTAGRCLNKKKMGNRESVVELSEKVLTSADRLRCTLIHELCHAATWIFNAEGGHGATWKSWASKASSIFPEIPKIQVCHQYDIEYKYTYKCTLCAAKSYAHSKSKKVDNIRCSYCYGAIEVFLNKKDKDGNIMPTPVREPTGFAKFVRDKYKEYKRPDLKHADVMKILSNEFAQLKVANAN